MRGKNKNKDGEIPLPKQNRMVRDAMSFLPAKIIEGLLLMACTSLYSYIFTKDVVGTFSLLNTNMQMAYLILAGWMANSATRYVGEEHAKDEGRKLFSTVGGVYVLICVLMVVGCGVHIARTGETIYIGFAFMFSMYTLFQILNASLVQLGRVQASIMLSLSSASLKLIVACVMVFALQVASPVAPVLATVIADGIAGLGAILVLRLPKIVRAKDFSKTLLRQFFAYGVPLVGVSIAVALLNVIDRYLVEGFYDKATLGVYQSNNGISSGLFTMIMVGIMRGVYPTVLGAWREGGQQAAQPMLNKGARLYLLIAVPAACGLTAISGTLSHSFLNEGYDAGAPVIAYTAIAMLFMGLTEYANKAYELEKKTVPVMQNSAVAAVIKVFASLLFIKLFGFTGGAIGSIVAFASYFFITYFRVRKRFVFHVHGKSLVRIVASGMLCGAAAYGCTLLHLPNVIRLALSVVAGALVYAICILVSGEGKEEMQAVMKKIRR